MTEQTLYVRLSVAQVAACRCDTKSPDIDIHDPLCPYRLFQESAVKIAEQAKENADLRLALADTVERCAKVCELTAETIDEKDMKFELTLYERVAGNFTLWNQQTHGYQKKEQLMAMAKILRALSPTSIEEVRGMQEDAERYRWLRNKTASLYDYVRFWIPNKPQQSIDEAIDAARPNRRSHE